MTRWGMVIDLDRCVGCNACTVACKIENGTPPDHYWARVYTEESGTYPEVKTTYVPVLCNHCEDAPCVTVCPTGASYQRDDGIVLVDQDKCIGCRMCMAACPYGARYFNYNEPPKPAHPFQHATPQYPVPQQKGTVGKCMFCVHRTADGKLPACVEACGMEAIYIGDLIEDVATNGHETVRLSQFIKDNDAFRHKEELGTGPRVYYIAGHGQLLDA